MVCVYGCTFLCIASFLDCVLRCLRNFVSNTSNILYLFCRKHMFICYATHPPTSSLSLLFIFLPYLSRFSWFSSIDFPFIHTFANECNKTTISHRWYTLVNISKMSDRVDSTHYHSLVSHMLYKNHSKCQRPRMRAYSHGVYQCET